MNDETKPTLKIISMCITALALIAFIVVCFGCTTINIIHSQGKAEDLIDETQTANPNVSTSLSSIPGV